VVAVAAVVTTVEALEAEMLEAEAADPARNVSGSG
jgi:hypothetical protein